MQLGRCCHCVPPVPWPGRIWRFLYPTAITDYESLQDAVWSTANLKETFNGATASPQFGGTEYACYYHVETVSDESTDDVEVIMQPIRYTLDQAAATDDDFDYWREGDPNDTADIEWLDVNNNQPLSSEGFLPISGDSHISDGKPAAMYLKDVLDFGGWLHAWRLYGGWNPTTNATPLPCCQNWEVSARYVRIRQNGTAIGTLFDMDTYWEIVRAQQYIPQVTGGLMGRYNRSTAVMSPTSYTLLYATSALAAAFPSLVQSAELTLVAGDVIEADIWYQFRSRPLIYQGIPQQPSQSRNIVGTISRHVVTTEERRRTFSQQAVFGGAFTSLHKCMILDNMKVSDGFDPSSDTYTFETTGGTWNFGDGTAGAHKAEAGSGWNAPVITSQRLTWSGTLAGSGSGGITFNATYTPLGGGFDRLDFEALTVTNGGAVSFAFVGGGATFNYTSTTTSAATFISDLETAMNNFITAQGADGFWSTAVATAFGTILTIDYSDAIGDLVPESGSGGPLGGSGIAVRLDWIDEICVLQVDVYETPTAFGVPVTSWLFRPQNSGDYVTQVTDRAEGTLVSDPCGVFNHLGTTTFEPWYGTHDSAASIPTDSDRPTSITVVKTTQ